MISLSPNGDQVINKIKFDFALLQNTSSNMGDVSDIKVLGTNTINTPITLNKNEDKKVPFSIPIDWEKTKMDNVKKAIIDPGKFFEDSKFLVTAKLKVKGSMPPRNVDKVVNVI